MRNAFFAACLLALACRAAVAATLPDGLKAGDAIAFLQWVDESGVVDSTTAHHGHWLLLKLGAAWCVPCVSEFNQVAALRASLSGNKNVQFAYVSWRLKSMSEPSFLVAEKRLRQSHMSDMPILKVAMPAQYSSTLTIPYTALIDPDGKIVESWSAVVRGDTVQEDGNWGQRVRRLLADQNLLSPDD